MRDILYMAGRYLAYNRIKTTILILSITLIVFLPAGLKILVRQSAESLTSRAEATPLIIGAKGSPLELVLNSLYFEAAIPAKMTFSESQRITKSKLANAIPLYTRFKARKFPIVGTTIDYFTFRALEVYKGRKMAVLGECVLGSDVATRLKLEPGQYIISSPESVFDIAGVYPLKLKVVGILAPTGTPDDRIVLVDLKTAWIIEGLAHGHQELANAEILERKGNVTIANASVMQFNEITPENIDSFHFHGDTSGFPITAVVAVPNDKKSGTLLQGKYLGDDERVQIVKPAAVMDELLGTVLTVQNYVVAAVVVIGFSTLMTAVLVFMLSHRLRKREIEAMHRIGGSKARVLGLLSTEITVVLLIGFICAGLLTLTASQFGAQLIRLFIL
jgi:putative ABC transport system permease protein